MIGRADPSETRSGGSPAASGSSEFQGSGGHKVNTSRQRLLYVAAIFCFMCVILAQASVADEPAVTVVLGQGLEIDIPKSWRILAGEYTKDLDSLVQRALDLSRITVKTGTLIAATSPLTTSWAYAEVRVTVERTFSQSQVASLSASDMAEYDASTRVALQAMLQSMGGQILKWHGTTRHSSHELTSLVSEYTRAPAASKSPRPSSGPIKVQVVVFPFTSRAVSLSLSYTDAGQSPQWQSTMAKIRSSFRIRPGALY